MRKLFLRYSEVIDQGLDTIRAAQMVEAFEVRLPIADSLIVEPVDNMFPIRRYGSSTSGWLAIRAGGIKLAW
jgi:hypothetical protein